MAHSSLGRLVLSLVLAVECSVPGPMPLLAQPWQGGHGDSDDDHGVYQRHRFHDRERDDRHDRRDSRRGFPSMTSPPVSAGWFQRPYPYHLDYYKMRYGGSYAPYFGNLYGPSGLPAYYGPYYGAYGAGYPDEFATPGYRGMPAGYPAGPGLMPPGTVVDESGLDDTESKPSTKSSANTIPAPKP